MHIVEVWGIKSKKKKTDRVFDHDKGEYVNIERDNSDIQAKIEFGEIPIAEVGHYDNRKCIILTEEEFNLLKERKGGL